MTAAFETALTIAPRIVEVLSQSASRDLSADYGLIEDWRLPRLVPELRPPRVYDSERFLILPSGEITVRNYSPGRGICDGSSLSPDTWLGLRAAIGSLVHDPWYMEMSKMAAAWGWDESRVRKLGDRVFASVLLAEARRLKGWRRFSGSLTANVYYRAVRAFGGLYHRHAGRIAKAAKLAALCAGLSLLSGCGGCVQSAFEEPGQYQTPAYTNASPYAETDGIETLEDALRVIRGGEDSAK